VMSSSETETRSRERSALDRDGTSLEGEPNPRARWNLTRGGDRPSSEAEPLPRGRPALERGGVLPVRHRPSSEAEFHLRVARQTVWWVVGPWVYLTRVLGSFALDFF
jgi:hypothetical protein